MTDNQEQPTESDDTSRTRWVNDIQEALDRTGDAIRTAWDASRETRMSALESAKQATHELGEAIDKGIAAGKDRWAANTQNGRDATPEEE